MDVRRRLAVQCVLCLLTAALMFPPAAAEAANELETGGIVMPTGDMAVRTPSQPMEMLTASEAQDLNAQMAAYTPQEDSLLVNRAENYYYYNNLDPIAKQIYDVMYGVAKDPVSPGNIGLMMTDMDPQGDEFYYEFELAYRSICFDHPELFWLYSREEADMCFSSEAVVQNGFYFVYFMMMEPFENFVPQMTAFNAAADAFLADIDTSISEYETIRQVHDKLIGLVDYDDPVAEDLSIFRTGQDLAHTAYGALVTDSAGNPNYAVCDGYSLAFEYLLQQCGIDTAFIGGMAGASPEDMGRHAWSLVKMDGAWYEVDTTWDDQDSLENSLDPAMNGYSYFMEALEDPVYRDLIDHYLFLVSTDRIRHFVPGDEYTYQTKDWMYQFSLVGESVHIRLEEDGTGDPDPAVFALAPTALESYGGVWQ